MVVDERLAPDSPGLDSLERPVAQALADLEDALLNEVLARVEMRRGQTWYTEFARTVGISRPLLRMMELNGILPGMDSLSIFLNWDSEWFEPLILRYMYARGAILRRR